MSELSVRQTQQLAHITGGTGRGLFYPHGDPSRVTCFWHRPWSGHSSCAHLGTRSADGNSFSVPYACELLKIGPAWCANPVLAAPASHMATGFAFFSCKLCSSFVPVFLFIGVLWNHEEDCERLAGVKSKPLGLAPSPSDLTTAGGTLCLALGQDLSQLILFHTCFSEI